MTAAPLPPVTCSRCGRSRVDATPAEALTWVHEKHRDRETWLCPVCARSHVRNIEGKLPDEYW